MAEGINWTIPTFHDLSLLGPAGVKVIESGQVTTSMMARITP